MLDSPETTTLIPAHLQELVEFLRNIALMAIPFVLFFAARQLERRRATLNMIRDLENPEVVDRLERLYLSRKHEEGLAAGLSQTPEDPYAATPALLYFDFVIVLNYYEAACAEIERDWLFYGILYASTRNTIIGAREVLLKRYSDKVGSDQSRHYPELCRVAERWRQRADPYREAAAISVPGD